MLAAARVYRLSMYHVVHATSQHRQQGAHGDQVDSRSASLPSHVGLMRERGAAAEVSESRWLKGGVVSRDRWVGGGGEEGGRDA